MIGMRLTRAGSNLIAKGLLGKEIHFTRGAIGDGEFDYESEKVFDLAEMRSEKMTLPIEELLKTGDGTVRITVHASNVEVYQGFPAKEHGIFAIDPDTGAEILYAYCNTGEEYSFIPSNTGPAAKDIKFSYVTIVRDAENVTATLDLSFAYTSTADFTEHINSPHPHPNIPNFYGAVTDTENLWATDCDNNLYQLSINNLKAILREDTEVAAAETFQSAKNELGLEANVLILEDFTSGGVTDNFKVRVTSSAENGLLLGLENVADLKTGAFYTISDGVNAEEVQIKSVRKNISGYHAALVKRLDNSYDWDATFLYRTTPALCDSQFVIYKPAAGFGGVEANIARVLDLDFSVKQDFEISGDGFIDRGYFTLG